ncbi:MAG: hypothetical protein IPJ03_14800 [Ignavibacteriales bacterium]|nr:hypothetical protein [Ignavibacteriales bacterium]
MAAESWSWNNDSTELTIELRNGILWTDKEKLTTEDVVYSFDLYSDPAVESRLFGTFDNFYTEENQHIDINKSFEIISPFKMIIKFKPHSNPNLFDIGIPLLPKHILEKYKRGDLPTAEFNFKPVSNGPFKLKNWDRNSAIILISDSNSFLYNKKNINELIFKIIPDYNNRINQLRSGEVDLLEDIKSEDANNFKKLKGFSIGPIKGRQYDFIGLSNIDNEEYNRTKKIKPHPLWGDKEIRKALTMAVNRQEILAEFLGGYGQLAYSPVTNIFNTSSDSSISPYQYNLSEAKNILKEKGWKDSDNNGIIEKTEKNFQLNYLYPR